MRIQHNIPAMSAYRNYTNNTSSLSKNLEKLSSGYKINRAGDDAAGLAISEKMRAQITGLEVAQKNAKDGISLVQTAEGALTEVHDMLNRMYELAEQSANGTYDNDVDRVQLQKEVNQLRTEINRIADSSNFNGIKLLDGSLAVKTEANWSSVESTKKSSGPFEIVADGQLGAKPQAGKFTYDLSQLKVTVSVDSDGKITLGNGAGSGTSSQALNALGMNSAGNIVTKDKNGNKVVIFGDSGIDGHDMGVDDDFGISALTDAGGPAGPGDAGLSNTPSSTSRGSLSISLNGLNVTVDLSDLVPTAEGTYTISGDKLVNKIAKELQKTISGSTSTNGAPGTSGVGGTGGVTGGSRSASRLSMSHDNEIMGLANTSGAGGTPWAGGKLAGASVSVRAEGTKLVVEMDSAPTQKWQGIDMTLRFSSGPNSGYNGGEQFAPTVEREPIDSTKTRQYAQATIDFNKMGGIADGTTLKLGDTTYVFAIGANSSFKNAENVVDLTDMTTDDADLKMVAANRFSNVAKYNKYFMVGSTTTADGVVTLTEREGAIDYSVNNLAGSDGKGTAGTEKSPTNGQASNVDATLADWKGLVSWGTSEISGDGLTLQIGDTAESFNQLNVSIRDCHADAIGIGDINISTQESAASAMDAIKNAINYVSDVRGTLGATQNRLDHTINNLSVMQENIQDAESTIRDTDVAAEMMEYTKNNILVQSAQAMLAQANQLPQGVLQLLQ